MLTLVTAVVVAEVALALLAIYFMAREQRQFPCPPAQAQYGDWTDPPVAWWDSPGRPWQDPLYGVERVDRRAPWWVPDPEQGAPDDQAASAAWPVGLPAARAVASTSSSVPVRPDPLFVYRRAFQAGDMADNAAGAVVRPGGPESTGDQLARARLEFTRWLVEHGRLSERL